MRVLKARGLRTIITTVISTPKERLFLLLYIQPDSTDLINAKVFLLSPAHRALFKPLVASPVKFMYGLLLMVALLCLPAKAVVRAVEPHRTAMGIPSQQETAARTESAEVKELKPGQPVERQIAEGQAHLYHIRLSAGQYLHLTVEQKDIDVGIHVLGPAGKGVSGINWEPPGALESLWAVVEASGEYQVKIIAHRATGKDQRYVIKLETIGDYASAPPLDRDHVKAYRLFWEAAELRDRGGEAAGRQAIEKYEEALPLWRALQEKVGEAVTLNELGLVVSRQGDYQKAIPLFEGALSIWGTIKNHQGDEGQAPQTRATILKPLG